MCGPQGPWYPRLRDDPGISTRQAAQIHHGTASSASPQVVDRAPLWATEPHTGRELAVSSVSHRGFTHLGLDVAKDSIVVAVLEPDLDRAPVQRIFHDEDSVRRLVERFEDRSMLWACYEAGPTGYELYRLLECLGVRCDVVAPSLIPKKQDRVKTDTRDARQLAGLHRAGQLTAIAVPSRPQEAVRDLCRLRGDMVADRDPGPQPVDAFLVAAFDRVARRVELDVQSINGGSPGCASMIVPWRRRSRTCGRRSRCATAASRPSRPTSSRISIVTRSGPKYRASPPIAGSPAWARSSGRGDLRLATLPGGTLVHVFHRARALGEVDRPTRTSRQHHPCRQPPRPRPTRRGRLGVSAPATRRHHDRGSTTRPHARRPRSLLERTGATQQTLRPTRRAQKRPIGCCRRDRSRARRFLVGRDDRRRGLNIMIVFEHPAIGDALLEATPTRRDTASAEPIPAGNQFTAQRGTTAQILGHPSAYRRIAIPTREHHCGGAPIHDVPARRNPNQHAPPTRRTLARYSRQTSTRASSPTLTPTDADHTRPEHDPKSYLTSRSTPLPDPRAF